ESGANARDLGMDGDQIGQELLGAERAERVSALKLSQMQGHVAAFWARLGGKAAQRCTVRRRITTPKGRALKTPMACTACAVGDSLRLYCAPLAASGLVLGRISMS